MKKVTLISLLVLVALVATALTVAAATPDKVYRAEMSGAPAGTQSTAMGISLFVFSNDGKILMNKTVVNGLDNTTMAHIHVASTPGGNGPIVLWLYPNAAPPILISGVFNGLLGGRTSTEADLTGAAGITTFEALRTAIEEGRAYVNVHTTLFPGGEIRGDIHLLP